VSEQNFALGATHRNNTEQRSANLHPTSPCSIQHLMFKHTFNTAPKTKADHSAASKQNLQYYCIFIEQREKIHYV